MKKKLLMSLVFLSFLRVEGMDFNFDKMNATGAFSFAANLDPMADLSLEYESLKSKIESHPRSADMAELLNEMKDAFDAAEKDASKIDAASDLLTKVEGEYKKFAYSSDESRDAVKGLYRTPSMDEETFNDLLKTQDVKYYGEDKWGTDDHRDDLKDYLHNQTKLLQADKVAKQEAMAVLSKDDLSTVADDGKVVKAVGDMRRILEKGVTLSKDENQMCYKGILYLATKGLLQGNISLQKIDVNLSQDGDKKTQLTIEPNYKKGLEDYLVGCCANDVTKLKGAIGELQESFKWTANVDKNKISAQLGHVFNCSGFTMDNCGNDLNARLLVSSALLNASTKKYGYSANAGNSAEEINGAIKFVFSSLLELAWISFNK